MIPMNSMIMPKNKRGRILGIALLGIIIIGLLWLLITQSIIPIANDLTGHSVEGDELTLVMPSETATPEIISEIAPELPRAYLEPAKEPAKENEQTSGKIINVNGNEIPVIVKSHDKESAKITYENEKLTIENGDKKLEFKGIGNNHEVNVKFDADLNDNRFIETYAIDPSNVEFESASIKVIAKGSILYKCKEWNFDEQKCSGQWAKIMDITPGQEYSLQITKDDPAFGEQPGSEGKDAYINSGSATRNYGAAATIDLSTTDAKRGLIEFNLSGIPANSTITNATLTLYLASKGIGASVPVTIQRINSSWTEGTGNDQVTNDGVSWNSRNGSVNWNTAGGDFGTIIWANTTVSTQDVFYTWDITNLTQNWINGTYPNYGMMLRTTSGNGLWKFASSEDSNATRRPMINITYSESTAPAINSVSMPSELREGSNLSITINATDNSVVSSALIGINTNNYSLSQSSQSGSQVIIIKPAAKGTIETNRVIDYQNAYDSNNNTKAGINDITPLMTLKTAGVSAAGTINNVKIKLIYSKAVYNTTGYVHWAINSSLQGTIHAFNATSDSLTQTEFDVTSERNWTFSDFNLLAEMHVNNSGNTLRVYEAWFEVNYTSSSSSNIWNATVDSSAWPAGTYNYTIYAQDTSGNLASTTGNFTILPKLVLINTTINNANNTLQQARIEIYDSNNELEFNDTNTETLLTSVESGEKGIVITPASNTIRKIGIYNAAINSDTQSIIRIDNPASSGYVQAYAIDPTTINFTNATVTVNALGNALYKCKNWSFETQTCLDNNWELFRLDLIPGEEYSFTITSDDPGFGETTILKYTLHNESDSQYSSYKEMKNVSADIGTVRSENISTATINYTCWKAKWLAPNWTINTAINGTYNFTIYTYFVATGVSTAAPSVRIFKYNTTSPNEYNISTTQGTLVSMVKNTQNIFTWGTVVPSGQYTNLTAGERVGIQVCANVTVLRTGGLFYMDIEQTTPSFVIFPNTTILGGGAPAVTLVSPANGNITSNNINFTCNATSELNLDNITFYWNYSGSFIDNGTTSITGLYNQTTFTRNNLADSTITWNCLACDNNSVCSFAPANYTVTAVEPDSFPTWSNNQTSIPSSYSASLSLFNITWQDDKGISVVFLESNFSGSSANYTMNLISGTTTNGIYNFSGILPAGTFYWKSSANDTKNQRNTSSTWIFTINPASQSITPLLNGINASLNIVYPQQINASYTGTNQTAVSIKINGTSVNIGQNYSWGVGAWDVNYSMPANQNYSSFEIHLNLTINQSAGLIYTYLNNSRSNLTISWGSSILLNATLINGVGNIQLYNNGTLINSGASPLSNLTAFNSIGLFNITSIYSGNQNYTASSETFYVNVTDVTSPSINFTSPSEVSGSFVSRKNILANVTASDSGTGLKNITINLYNSTGSLINSSNSTSDILYTNFSVSADGLYYFNATAFDNSGNQNSTETRNVTIDTTAPVITIASPLNQTYNNKIIWVNFTADSYQALWFNNGTANRTYISPESVNLSDGSYTFVFYANDSVNNLNITTVTFSVFTQIPPDAVSNLQNISGTTWIYWNWTNPVDRFNSAILYLDEINIANTSNNYYNATSLLSGVNYTLRINTLGNAGQINYTNVSSTAATIPVPTQIKNESTTTSSGEIINTTLTIISSNGSTIYNSTSGTHDTSTIDSGYYDIGIKPLNNTISDISITHVYLANNVTKIVDIDNFNIVNTSGAYAINTYINFTSLTLTIKAAGTDLYKCANWNFSARNCTDNSWIKVLDVIPGQTYTLTLNPGDPGFIEVNYTKYYLHNETDSQWNTYKKLINSTTEIASVQSEAINLNTNPPYMPCWISKWIAPNSTLSAAVNGTWNFTIYYSQSATGATAYLFAKILKINASGAETNFYNLSQSANIGGTGAAPTAIPWSANLPASSYTNLSPGERIGMQVCINVTAKKGANAYIYWENTTMSNAIFPVALYDDTSPSINFTNPTEISGSIVSRKNILANVTASDSGTGLKNITINLYNSTGSLVNSSNSTSSNLFSNFSVSADGLYYFNATAFDNSGNQNSTETRNVTIDTTAPVITIYSPLNQSYNNKTILVNFTADSYQALWFYNGTGNQSYTPGIYVDANESSNTWIFYANDSVGNLNITYRTFSVDTIAPIITIYSPLNTTYNNKTIWVNFTANDYQALWFNNGTANISYSAPGYANANEGGNTWIFYANDSVGNLNQTSRAFNVDTIAPSISIISPKNNTNYNNKTLLVNISTSGADYVWFFNGTANETYLGSPVYRTFASGNNTIYAYANDSIGNFNQTSSKFFTDIKAPSVNITSPENKTYNNRTVLVEILAENIIADTSLDTIWYNWNGTNITYIQPINVTFNEGSNTLYAYANDTVGNVGNSSVVFSTDTTPPAAVTNLKNISSGTTWIYWNWTNPTDSDFNSSIIFINGNNVANITGNFYNKTELFCTTEYAITIWTKDNMGNINYTNVNNTASTLFCPDVIAPVVHLISPANNTLTNQPNQVFECSISDANIANLTLYVWNSTSLIHTNTSALGGIYNSSDFSFTLPYDGNFTWNCFGEDDSSNNNWSIEGNYTIILETIAPYWSNLKGYPNQPVSYSQGQFYQFNITWDGTQQNVWINWNGTNYTNVIANGNVYSFNRIDLAAENYSYSWYANDSAGNVNSTGLLSYTITPASQSITPLLNGVNSNLNIIYPQQINASYTGTNQTAVTIKINGTSVNIAQNYTWGAGSWIVNYSVPFNQNYSEFSITLSLTVNQSAGAGTLLLNGTNGNINLTYPGQVNASFTNSTGNGTLWRNVGTDVTSLNNQFENLAVGYYNFTLNVAGSQNYSSASISRFANITQATPVLNALLNGAHQNISIIYPQQVNASGTTTGGNLTIYKNGTAINNGQNYSIAAGYHQFDFNVTGNQNYTSVYDVLFANVTNAIAQTSLVFDKTSPQNYSTAINASCTRISGEGNVALYRNGFDVTTNENNKLIVLGVNTHNYNCSILETQNYTYAENISSFTINQAIGTVQTYLNNSRINITIVEGTSILLNATLVKGFGIIQLYKNGTLIYNGTTPYAGNLTAFNSVGLFNITSIYSGNENYTSSFETFYVTVSDAFKPSINFTNPTEISGGILKRNNIVVNITANDTNLAGITAYLYNSTSFVDSASSLNSVLFNNFTNLANGVYYFNATAFDTSGNTNSTETRNVTLDTLIPSISITYPQNTNYTVNVSSLNYTVYDINLQACWYSLDLGITNKTIIPCGTNLTNLASNEGINTWTVYANDSAGNLNYSRVTFFKDSIKPSIQFVNPTTQTGNYSKTWIAANVTANDTNIQSIVIRLYNSSALVNSTSGTSPLFINFTNLADGTYYLNATANDTFGNSNSTETRTIGIDTKKPVIMVYSPLNQSYNNKTILVNFTANSYQALWFNNGTANISYYSSEQYVNVTEGSHTFVFYANDSVGNFNQTSVTFFVDSIAPSIAITYPQNTSYTINVSSLNYTVSDTNLQACWYSLNGGANIPIACGTNLTGLTSLEGSNNWTVYANDSAGNMNYSRVTFFKDTIAPAITIASPLNQTYNNRTILVNITLNEAGAIWFFNGTANESYPGPVYRTFNESSNTLRAYANDTLGNFNYSSVTFYIDSIKPSIQFVDPTTQTGNYSKTWIAANVTANDTNFANITINLYNSSKALINSSDSTSSPLFINFTNLADGTYYLNATATDIAGNVNSTETRSMILDTAKPSVQFVSPTEDSGSYINRNNIKVNVTALDEHLKNITVRLYNSTGLMNSTASTTLPISPYFVNFTSLIDGIYYFNATAYDTIGNYNYTETRYATIDRVPPTFNTTQTRPGIGRRVAVGENVSLEINTTDNSGIANVIANISWDSTSEIVSLTFNSGTGKYEGTFTNTLVEGRYNITFTSTDVAGNSNTTYTYFIVYESTPPAIIYTNISNYAPIINETAFLDMNATDNVAVDKMFVNITLPNGTTNTYYNLPVYFNATSAGRYNITFIANDTAGNQAVYQDYFISGNNVTVQFNVIGYNSSGINNTLVIYLASTDKQVHLHEFTGTYLDQHAGIIYDLLFKAYSDPIEIKLKEVNITLDNNKTIGIDKLNIPASGYIVTYGVNSTYTIANATVKLSYANATYSDENYLRLYRCDDWNFASRTCSGVWQLIASEQNKTSKTLSVDVSGFSGFSIKDDTPAVPVTPIVPSVGGGAYYCIENWTCGDWNCTDGYAERTCTDANKCGTIQLRPSEKEECSKVSNCFNHIKDGIESDVDCGGLCSKCIVGKKCVLNEDCITNICYKRTCMTKEAVPAEKPIVLPIICWWIWMLVLLTVLALLILLNLIDSITKTTFGERLNEYLRAKKQGMLTEFEAPKAEKITLKIVKIKPAPHVTAFSLKLKEYLRRKEKGELEKEEKNITRLLQVLSTSKIKYQIEKEKGAAEKERQKVLEERRRLEQKRIDEERRAAFQLALLREKEETKLEGRERGLSFRERIRLEEERRKAEQEKAKERIEEIKLSERIGKIQRKDAIKLRVLGDLKDVYKERIDKEAEGAIEGIRWNKRIEFEEEKGRRDDKRLEILREKESLRSEVSRARIAEMDERSRQFRGTVLHFLHALGIYKTEAEKESALERKQIELQLRLSKEKSEAELRQDEERIKLQKKVELENQRRILEERRMQTALERERLKGEERQRLLEERTRIEQQRRREEREQELIARRAMDEENRRKDELRQRIALEKGRLEAEKKQRLLDENFRIEQQRKEAENERREQEEIRRKAKEEERRRYDEENQRRKLEKERLKEEERGKRRQEAILIEQQRIEAENERLRQEEIRRKSIEDEKRARLLEKSRIEQQRKEAEAEKKRQAEIKKRELKGIELKIAEEEEALKEKIHDEKIRLKEEKLRIKEEERKEKQRLKLEKEKMLNEK